MFDVEPVMARLCLNDMIFNANDLWQYDSIQYKRFMIFQEALSPEWAAILFNYNPHLSIGIPYEKFTEADRAIIHSIAPNYYTMLTLMRE